MDEILIDITRLLGRFMKGRLPTGVDRVSLAYVQQFAQRAKAVVRLRSRPMILPRRDSENLFEKLLQPSYDFNWTMLPPVLFRLLNIRSTRPMPGAFFFNTGHSGLEREDYMTQLRRLGLKTFSVIHDLIPITHPEYCRPGELNRHIARMNNVLRLSSGVIANSRTTLDELRHFAAKGGLPMPPAVVAPLAPSRLPSPSSKRPLDSPYFVVIGTIEPRKNHSMLLQLWRKLIERMGDKAPMLVIIGRRGWECENVVDLLERCEALRGFVTELRACSDMDLATWLHHAQALLFPSFAEGYGLPLIEALTLGVPVIASDLPAFREIAGDIPDYLDPLDGKGWQARIEAFAARDSSARAEQSAKISQFVPPTWQDHFAAVGELLERTC